MKTSRYEMTSLPEHTIDYGFGRFVRHCRTDAGLTLQEAVRVTGLSMDRITLLETGEAARGVTAKELMTLACAYRVPQSELYDYAVGNRI